MLVQCSSSSHPQAEANKSLALASCGGVASTELTVTNRGDEPLTFTATAATVPLFDVSPASGTIAPGTSQQLTVTGHAPPGPGSTYSSFVLLDSNDPLRPSLRIPLQFDTSGADLRYSATELDFGDLPLGVAASLPFTVHNAGNAQADVSLPVLGDFGVRWLLATNSATVAVGADVLATATFTPFAIGPRSADWAPSATSGRLCGGNGPLLKGRGVDGLVGITPGSLDFGMVPCSTGGGSTRTFSIINAGKAPFNFTATLGLGDGSLFTVTPTTGVVPPEAKLDIVIALKGMPAVSSVMPDVHADSVTVTTDAPKDQPHAVALHVTAEGAIVRTNPGTVDFQKVEVGASKQTSVQLVNDGNAPVTVAASAPSPFGFQSASSVVLAGGVSNSITATVVVQPQALGVPVNDMGTVSLVTGTLCAPLPTIPLEYTAHEKAAAMGTSAFHACATGQSGTVYCWGYGGAGQLGDGTTPMNRDTPSPVFKLTKATGYSLTSKNTCAVSGVNGLLYCWGAHVVDGGYDLVPAAQWQLGALKVGVSEDPWTNNPSHACAIDSTHQAWCWGVGTTGQLGNGADVNSATPVKVSGLTDAVAISVFGVVNAGNSCAVRQNGQVVCWGSNGWAELGGTANSPPYSNVPVAVPNVSDAIDVVGGRWGYCALRSGSSAVSCWGNNSSSILGVNPPPNVSDKPYDVAGVGVASLLAHGGWHACAVEQGTARCWGANGVLQLLDPMVSVSPKPLVIPNVSNVVAIQAAQGRTMAILSDGTVRWWGQYQNGMPVKTAQTVAGFD